MYNLFYTGSSSRHGHQRSSSADDALAMLNNNRVGGQENFMSSSAAERFTALRLHVIRICIFIKKIPRESVV